MLSKLIQNYFTCELLPDNISSEVALFNIQHKLVAAIFGGKLMQGSVLLPASAAAVSKTDGGQYR